MKKIIKDELLNKVSKSVITEDGELKWYYEDMKKSGIPEQWGGGYYLTDGMVVMPDGRLEEMD